MVPSRLLSALIASMFVVAMSAPAPLAGAQEQGSESSEQESREAAAQDESEVLRIVRAADAATRAVESITYDAESIPTGAFAGVQPVVRGTVTKAANPAGGGPLIIGEGWLFQPHAQVDRAQAFRFKAAWDGEVIKRLNLDAKTWREGPPQQAGDVLGPVPDIDMIEFGHPTPFTDEINAKVQTLEGQTYVGDVRCNVVYVEYSGAGEGQSARWCFGVEDNLPRRVERLAERDGKAAARVLTITNLKLNPELEDDAFTIEVPEDFTREEPGEGSDSGGRRAPRPDAAPRSIGGGGS